MLSLTLIFRNFHLAARGADRWRQVPQPTPQSSELLPDLAAFGPLFLLRPRGRARRRWKSGLDGVCIFR
jgi:hypothetical protein